MIGGVSRPCPSVFPDRAGVWTSWANAGGGVPWLEASRRVLLCDYIGNISRHSRCSTSCARVEDTPEYLSADRELSPDVRDARFRARSRITEIYSAPLSLLYISALPENTVWVEIFWVSLRIDVKLPQILYMAGLVSLRHHRASRDVIRVLGAQEGELESVGGLVEAGCQEYVRQPQPGPHCTAPLQYQTHAWMCVQAARTDRREDWSWRHCRRLMLRVKTLAPICLNHVVHRGHQSSCFRHKIVFHSWSDWPILCSQRERALGNLLLRLSASCVRCKQSIFTFLEWYWRWWTDPRFCHDNSSGQPSQQVPAVTSELCFQAFGVSFCCWSILYIEMCEPSRQKWPIVHHSVPSVRSE